MEGSEVCFPGKKFEIERKERETLKRHRPKRDAGGGVHPPLDSSLLSCCCQKLRAPPGNKQTRSIPSCPVGRVTAVDVGPRRVRSTAERRRGRTINWAPPATGRQRWFNVLSHRRAVNPRPAIERTTHQFLLPDAMLAPYMLCPSVCPSVCHKCRITQTTPMINSSFLTTKISLKFDWVIMGKQIQVGSV